VCWTSRPLPRVGGRDDGVIGRRRYVAFDLSLFNVD